MSEAPTIDVLAEDEIASPHTRGDTTAQGVRFWMVWNKNGGAPKVTHKSYENAASEACRLARKCPGEKFIVLQAQRKFWVEAPATTEAEQDAEAAAAMRSAA